MKFTLNDVSNYKKNDEKVIRNACNLGILKKENNNYSFERNLNKKNDAGTKTDLNSNDICEYEKIFREANNVGMQDAFLEKAKADEVLNKAINNSLKAATTYTSLEKDVGRNKVVAIINDGKFKKLLEKQLK